MRASESSGLGCKGCRAESLDVYGLLISSRSLVDLIDREAELGGLTFNCGMLPDCCCPAATVNPTQTRSEAGR